MVYLLRLLVRSPDSHSRNLCGHCLSPTKMDTEWAIILDGDIAFC